MFGWKPVEAARIVCDDWISMVKMMMMMTSMKALDKMPKQTMKLLTTYLSMIQL